MPFSHAVHPVLASAQVCTIEPEHWRALAVQALVQVLAHAPFTQAWPVGQAVEVQSVQPFACAAQVCTSPVALHWTAPAVQRLVQVLTQDPPEQVSGLGQAALDQS